MSAGVLLFAHGTIDSLDELPEFLTTIRRGSPPPPELLAELHHRYDAIGGKSPLNDINRSLARRLEEKLGVPVRMANRLARPHARDVIAEMAMGGVDKLAVVPLAQYSVHVYDEAARKAASEAAPAMSVACAPSWSQEPALIEEYARGIQDALGGVADASKTTILMTAHSLPTSVIAAGDPYEREVRASAAAVEARIAREQPASRAHVAVAFQSQGMSKGPGGRPVEWLGPDLPASLDEAKRRGDAHVVIAPIGFLADHIEVLYDIDIEAKKLASDRGLTLSRTRSLNDGDAMVSVLAAVAGRMLA